MLDHDPSEFVPRLDPADLLAKLTPIIGNPAMLVRGSVSSGVRQCGDSLKPCKGYHVYIPVLDASDIPRAGEALVQRLWLAGLGVIALSKSGSMLERTIIDGAVFSGERLDFTGKPVLVDDFLEYVPPVGEYHDGDYLDTAVIKSLISKELNEYNSLVAIAKQAMGGAAQSAKLEFVDTKLQTMVAAGVDEDAARKQLNAFVAGSGQDLPLDFVLHFATRGEASVAHVLADPLMYDNEALADPIEGPDYGLTTAKFYANIGQGNEKPVIHSMSHGMNTVYFLPSTIPDIALPSANPPTNAKPPDKLPKKSTRVKKDKPAGKAKAKHNSNAAAAEPVIDPDKSAADYFSVHNEEPYFAWHGYTYYGYQKLNKEGEVESTHVTLLLDCTIKIVYSIETSDIDDRPILEHVLELDSNSRGKQRLFIESGVLAAVERFRTALHQRQCVYYGDMQNLNGLSHHLFKSKSPMIRALSVVGYDAKSQGFFFPKFYYDKEGQRFPLNGDKFFSTVNVQPFQNGTDPVIHRLDTIDIPDFICDLKAAFGPKGLLALGFWVATAVSHKIFDHYGFFPFLSLYGKAHCGKSFLTKMLNRCFFVDAEGSAMTNLVAPLFLLINQRCYLFVTYLLPKFYNKINDVTLLPNFSYFYSL